MSVIDCLHMPKLPFWTSMMSIKSRTIGEKEPCMREGLCSELNCHLKSFERNAHFMIVLRNRLRFIFSPLVIQTNSANK